MGRRDVDDVYLRVVDHLLVGAVAARDVEPIAERIRFCLVTRGDGDQLGTGRERHIGREDAGDAASADDAPSNRGV